MPAAYGHYEALYLLLSYSPIYADAPCYQFIFEREVLRFQRQRELITLLHELCHPLQALSPTRSSV